MAKCVEKIGSIQVFLADDGTYNAYDFKNGLYIADPYKDKPPDYKPVIKSKSPAEIEEELAEIKTYQTLTLPDRKLKKEYLEYFGIKIGVSEEDGTTPRLHYYPYYKGRDLIGYKVRLIENKQMWAVGSTKGCDLFGWNKAILSGAKRLYITEGELDAVSLYQIFKDQSKGTAYSEFSPAIVSLAHGAGSAARDLGKYLPDIRRQFKEIALVFDQDAPGKEAVERVLQVIPDALVVELPDKDANECLKNGKGKAAHAACQFKAVKPKNTRIVSGNDLHESAKEQAKHGVSWPWDHVTKATRGIRTGETIYIGAAPKLGKSEMVNAITAHLIKEHNWKVFLVKPEEANKKTYKLVAGKLVGKVFHDPNREFDMSAYEKAGEIMKDHLFMLNLYQHVGWDSLKADIRQAANEGCKAVVIDPITNLTNGMSAADANVKLQEIAQELSAMALDLDIVIFIFCHLRNPESGLDHQRGGIVLSSQFAGSRSMERSCNYMFGIQGNRDPGLSVEERNIRTLVLLSDREFGEVGEYKLYWDTHTQLFNEIP